MTPFGEKIRQLRAARGVALKEMAAALFVSPAYLSALEHGRRSRPSDGLVRQICAYFGLIWEEAEALERLAALSHPKIAIDTGGLSPLATEFANRLAECIGDLDDPTLRRLLDALPPRAG